MSVLNYRFWSKVLNRNEELIICGNLKDKSSSDIMFFFHGLGSDNKQVLNNSQIDMICEKNNIIAVLPNVSRSYYKNMENGYNYEDYVINEVYEVTDQLLSLDIKNKFTFTNGFSMGGYGALYLAFKYQEHFSGCCSISGSLDILRTTSLIKLSNKEFRKKEWYNTFGENDMSNHDLKRLVLNYNKPVVLCCATHDDKLIVNQKFGNFLHNEAKQFFYFQEEGYHDYFFVNKVLEKTIINIKKFKEKNE